MTVKMTKSGGISNTDFEALDIAGSAWGALSLVTPSKGPITKSLIGYKAASLPSQTVEGGKKGCSSVAVPDFAPFSCG